jgi:hypothetical protein
LVNVTNCLSTAIPGTTACPTISPSSVHYIINNTFAINALCGGNPFACTVGRNVTRTEPRNQVDLSLQKNFKLTERLGLVVRGDAINAFNYQFYGVPGLNSNNKNAAGMTCSPIAPGGTRTVANCMPALVAPNTFGETWGTTGTNRAIFVSGHITF